MNDIKVSVIVPVYNKEPYLTDCLDSIINQTLKEIEIIIIDDGSTDGSADICKKYLVDNRVKYHYKNNEGLAAARQDGIDLSCGEYIGFIDADDWIEPDMFEKMYNSSIECGADVAFCNKIYGENDHKATPEIPAGVYNRKEIIEIVLPKTLAFINEDGDKRVISWSNCRRIFRKDFIISNNISFDRRFRRSQDLHFTYNAMLYSKCFLCMSDNYFYHVRVVSDSLARGYTKNMWPLYVNLINSLYSDTEKFPELNLMSQMHLRAFFFACECIDNELKPTCPNDKETRIKLVEEIMNDPICDRFYGRIEVDKLNDLLKGYYKYIHEKKAEKLLDFIVSYKAQQEKKRKTKAAIMNFLTESKFVGTVYKKVRNNHKV